MNIISQYFPFGMLILLVILYISENKFVNLKLNWLFDGAVVILHTLTIIHFLTAEFAPEIVLLFLLASFAAAITFAKLKINLK